MIYISVEQVIELHDTIVKEFGGLHGIRSHGQLESALATPMMTAFGEEMHKSVYDKAAVYLFSITKNHPFLDGNKRTATATALLFLRVNGASPKYDVDDFVEFVVEVAAGNTDRHEVSRYLEQICS